MSDKNYADQLITGLEYLERTLTDWAKDETSPPEMILAAGFVAGFIVDTLRRLKALSPEGVQKVDQYATEFKEDLRREREG